MTMHKEEPAKAKKERSTAQFWSRREKIDQAVIKLKAERDQITEMLKHELG